jgi:hypothetical protein
VIGELKPQAFRAANPVYAVRATASGEIQFVVEAKDIQQAEGRARCIGSLYGEGNVSGRHVATATAWPSGTPVFLEGFFDGDAIAGGPLGRG